MIGKTHNVRLILLFGVFITFGSVLLSRLFVLQCLHHREFRARARELHQRISRLPPRRGVIYDAKKNILAMSVENLSVFAVPDDVENPGRAASLLAPLLGLDRIQIERKLAGGGYYARLKRHLSDREVEGIQRLSLPGVRFEKEMKRVYPKGKFLGPVLGFADLDGEGREGLELKFDDKLRGRPGWLVTERDSKQREVSWFRHQDLEPVDGINLVLTIDEMIQHIAEDELRAVVEQYRANWGTILVMEPTAGNLLALANYPDFDPNFYFQSPPDHRRNRAVTDTLEPGSTFKVLPASAALEAGMVDLDTEFYCENGCFRTASFTLHDHQPHGTLRFEEIIQKSSNIGMAKVGMLLEEKNLYRSLAAFGINERTGVDLPGEASGYLPHPKNWSRLSSSRITMGHEVAVTPLGLLAAFSALGNRGIVLRPRIVDRLENGAGDVVYRFPRGERGRAVSEATARKMLRVLRTVVGEDGTGHLADIPGYQVAGKTGTAQKLEPEGGYSHRRFVALFLGLLPASDPKIAILVVVDEPKPLYYGGVVAAPAFRRVAEQVIRYLDLKPVDNGVLL